MFTVLFSLWMNEDRIECLVAGEFLCYKRRAVDVEFSEYYAHDASKTLQNSAAKKSARKIAGGSFKISPRVSKKESFLKIISWE